MRQGLDYSTLPVKRTWWRWWFAVPLVPAVLFAALVVDVLRDWDSASVSATVDNRSTVELKAVQLRVGPRVVLDLGDVGPGRHVEKSKRVKGDPGPVSLHAATGNGTYTGTSWLVLGGKGPYEYTITALPDHVHVERWSPPKGTWTEDIRPAPTSAPSE